jgi:hypothetical protein
VALATIHGHSHKPCVRDLIRKPAWNHSWPNFLDPPTCPNDKELKEALDKIRSLEERIGRLENELDALKMLLQKEG